MLLTVFDYIHTHRQTDTRSVERLKQNLERSVSQKPQICLTKTKVLNAIPPGTETMSRYLRQIDSYCNRRRMRKLPTPTTATVGTLEQTTNGPCGNEQRNTRKELTVVCYKPGASPQPWPLELQCGRSPVQTLTRNTRRQNNACSVRKQSRSTHLYVFLTTATAQHHIIRGLTNQT